VSYAGITPVNDWVLVKMDPFPEKKGSIIVLEDSTANIIRTGTVMAVGKGKTTPEGRVRPDVECGEKVAFLRWHLEHKTGKQITSFLEGMGDDLGLIKAADILFAYPAGETIEVG